MTIRNLLRLLWLGMALIVASSLLHLWLEIYRGVKVAPQLQRGPALVAHTYEVIATAQNIDRALQDAERGERGFLITGNAAHLQDYRKGSNDAPALVEKLRTLTADNPEQQQRIPVLQEQVNSKLAELKNNLDIRERKGPEAAQQAVLANIGLNTMESARKVIDAAIDTERVLLAERLGRSEEYEKEGRKVAVAGGVLALAVLVVGVAMVLLAFRNILRSEAARRRSDERYGLLIKGVTDYAIYMLDVDGNVMEWNAGAERIKGYTAEEIIGQHFSRFYTEEDRNAGVPRHALETAVQKGKYEAEGWRVRKDGNRFYASVLIDPLRDVSGKLVGFAKITRDIGERVQQQQALAQYAKMDALGQLTGGIAHDFNNLIHVIRNAIEIVQRRLPANAPDVSEYINMVKRNADRAASLTQRLLAFSRRQVLDPKPINPNSLIVDVTTLLRQVLGESTEIETVVSAGIWWVNADANQLETAILNLALNARDAMNRGGKLTVEVTNAFLDESYASSHPDVKVGQYVMIAVSDTGSGMTKEVMDKAFDPFFTTKEVGQGTGLGLSQVYGFIKQSGGHAKIYSEPGEGTTVKLYLPRIPGSPVAEHQPKPRFASAGTGTETILAVEDEDDVRQFTAEVLSELGYRVLTARDAASALRLLEENPDIQLLFTDIGLPGGINGRALADEFRRRLPNLKVLFTTGYTRNAIIHHGRLDPGVNLLLKPFNQISLGEKVRQVLGGGK